MKLPNGPERVYDVKRHVNLAEIPLGIWKGQWSGYEVWFTAGGTRYITRVTNGIRGTADVRVHVKKLGEIWVEKVEQGR